MGPDSRFSCIEQMSAEEQTDIVERIWSGVGDDVVPISEPCKESASKDRCLCTSMEAGMRSPGLYWTDLVSLDRWLLEQPRAKEMEGAVVRVEDMVCIDDG